MTQDWKRGDTAYFWVIKMPDKFPEAFERFEERVDTRNIRSFSQLKAAFSSWAGFKWIDSPKQHKALRDEARKLNIPIYEYSRPERPSISRPSYRWQRRAEKAEWTRQQSPEAGHGVTKELQLKEGFKAGSETEVQVAS